MRLTQTLYKINRIRVFKLRWEQIKRRKAPENKAYMYVQKAGIPTVQPEEFLKAAEEEVVPFMPDKDIKPAEPLFKKEIFDESHPLYQPEPCYCIKDDNVLLEGLNQSKILLNAVQIQEGLPKEIEDMIGTRAVPFQDTRVKRSVMYSNVYDAMQVPLPKRKDPERPAWVFPRDYGIDSKRKFQLTITQMLQLCDFASESSSIANRTHLDNAYCCAHLEKEGRSIQIQNRADFLITSRVPISPLASRADGNSISLPDIHPLKFTVSIPQEHFYHSGSIYPLADDYWLSHPHTAFFHWDPTEVKNLYEEPVTESQFFSRTLVKAFAVAASRAQQLYGDDVKQLPEPITLQVVHTDNKKYHFAILQLNTLDLNGTNPEKNIFWMHPNTIDLFSTCAYVKGRPTLEGFNPEVFQRVLAFYCNGLP